MTFSFLRILLGVGMAVVAAAALLLVAGALGSLLSDEPLQTSLAAVTDRPVERAITFAQSAKPGALLLSHGVITFRPDAVVYALQILHVVLVLAATFGSLWLLRRIILAIAGGSPFGADTIRRIRALGLIQLAGFIWLLVHEIILQSLVVPKLMVDGAAILPSIATRRPGIENIQIDFTVDFALLAGGFIALALAEAFRLGTALREDSEAIV